MEHYMVADLLHKRRVGLFDHRADLGEALLHLIELCLRHLVPVLDVVFDPIFFADIEVTAEQSQRLEECPRLVVGHNRLLHVSCRLTRLVQVLLFALHVFQRLVEQQVRCVVSVHLQTDFKSRLHSVFPQLLFALFQSNG